MPAASDSMESPHGSIQLTRDLGRKSRSTAATLQDREPKACSPGSGFDRTDLTVLLPRTPYTRPPPRTQSAPGRGTSAVRLPTSRSPSPRASHALNRTQHKRTPETPARRPRPPRPRAPCPALRAHVTRAGLRARRGSRPEPPLFRRGRTAGPGAGAPTPLSGRLWRHSVPAAPCPPGGGGGGGGVRPAAGTGSPRPSPRRRRLPISRPGVRGGRDALGLRRRGPRRLLRLLQRRPCAPASSRESF